jgi:hypothetical protein
MTGALRQLRIPWTARNMDRVTKWLRLSYDWQGFILRDGQRIGYKTARDGREICFTFFKEKL